MSAGRIGALSWLRILCATLLLSLGLAHKPVYAQPQADPASSFYLLPDGTYATICYGGDQGHHPQKAATYGCDICRIADSVLLPQPAAEPAPSLTACCELDSPSWVAAVDLAPARPGAPVRGPPLLSA